MDVADATTGHGWSSTKLRPGPWSVREDPGRDREREEEGGGERESVFNEYIVLTVQEFITLSGRFNLL